MKKNINTGLIAAILMTVVVLIASPAQTKAATIYVESSRDAISVGDTAIITVKINADGSVLNTVDGEITLKSSSSNLSVQEFSLANSSFGLWPRTPSVSADGHTISFVGGVPGGFSIEGATLFSIVVLANKEGTITVSPQNISVFSNDGQGTKLPVQLKDITINVTPKNSANPIQNDWASIVSKDTTPPNDFIIVLGQEKTLFDGKKFAFFSALDNQSGIDHYDVSENGAPMIRSGSTYVLQDQSDNVKLNVIAYDKAGNKKSAAYSGETMSKSISWIPILIVVILIIAIYIAFKVWKKNKKNAPNSVI